MVGFKPESMSCVRNVLEVWAFKGKGFKWKHHFICFIPIQQDVYGVRAHYGLTFSARKNITIVLVAAGRSGRDAPLHVFFYKQGGRVKLQHCGWCGQGAVWIVDVVGTSNRHQEQLSNSGSSCPSGAWEPAVSSAHVRAVDSSREGNLKTVLDSSATQRNTVQGVATGSNILQYHINRYVYLLFVVLSFSDCVYLFADSAVFN